METYVKGMVIGMKMTIHAGKNDNHLFVTNENAAKRRAAEKKGTEKKGTIYAGDVGLRPDSIQMKRRQAQKKAMKIMKDTFASDLEIDQSMRGMAARASELRDQTAENHREYDQIAVTRNELAENYGIEEDSQEVEDLELLRKEKEAANPASGVYLSYMEERALAKIHEQGLTAYEKDMLELDDKEKLLENQIKGDEMSIKSIRTSLSDTKIERLKSEPMQEAQAEAEEIMMAANKEIYGDLVNEGKKHIEEKMAEEKEKAAKRAEKKEEEEEKEANRKEQEALQEAWVEGTKEAVESKRENLPDAADIDNMASYNNPDAAAKTKADREIEQMLEAMQLLQDDIKGAAVDAGL